jgi:hypothetical protein
MGSTLSHPKTSPIQITSAVPHTQPILPDAGKIAIAWLRSGWGITLGLQPSLNRSITGRRRVGLLKLYRNVAWDNLAAALVGGQAASLNELPEGPPRRPQEQTMIHAISSVDQYRPVPHTPAGNT